MQLLKAAFTEDNLIGLKLEGFRQHLERLNLLEIDFSRVYNCDESVFLLSSKKEYVLVKKESKSVHKLVNNDKEYLTTLFMVNATGVLVSPNVYVQTMHRISSQFPQIGQLVYLRKDGCSISFFEFISNNFYQWLVSNNIKFPIVLYVDGYSSHLTLLLLKFCRSIQIELIAL